VERLKKFLRYAISNSAHCLKLQVGTPCEMLGSGGAVPLDDGLPVDDAYMEKLYATLMPSEQGAIASKSLARGILNVPQIGKISLIAQPTAPASLRLYIPPQGAALFESDWQRFLAASESPKSMTQSPMPGSIGSPQVFGGPTGVPQGLGLDFASSSEVQTHDGYTTAKNDMQEPSASQGFVPSFLASVAASPQVGVVEKHSPPSGLAVAGAAPKPEIPAFGAPMSPTPIYPVFESKAARLSDKSLREDAPRLQFDADAAGDSGISTGSNRIDPILTDMVKRRASDLHLTGGEPLCMRVDGEIERVGKEPLDPQGMESYILPILPPRNLSELAESNDSDFSYEIVGVGRFRVNVFRDKNGIGAVMRHIPSTILSAEKLGLAPAITRFCGLTKGLVLVTGPTGSGKSTTLAAMVDLINRTRCDHILTIEDPIEFVHPQQKCLVNQREVHKHTKSFARALKAALREDPDIILIGEMRDLETIAIAIETAETGHLVFGTLHTTTAVSTVDRIIDQFPADRQAQIRTMLASSLKGVVAQTLLKKKGGGRVAAHEILVVTDPVSAMIREGKNHMIANHMQTQKVDGNQLLNEALFKLVKDGIVDADDAMRKAVDKGTLADIYRRSGVKTAEVLPQPAGRSPSKSA
jgi:pilus retraction protein PilT